MYPMSFLPPGSFPKNSQTTRALLTVAAWLTIGLLAVGASVGSYDARGPTVRSQLVAQVNVIQLASAELTEDLVNAETGQREIR